MTVKELQRVMSPGSCTVIHLQQCLRAPFEVIPRTRQTTDAKETMITIFFTARELILLEVLPKGSKSNQQYFIDSVFPDLKKGKPEFSSSNAACNFLGAHG
jgi:hypothetical protein